MKIGGFFNAFSYFPFKFKNTDETQTPLQEEKVYVINETNRREEFTDENIKGFLNMIEDETIQQFLAFDRCYKLADNYLLAIVFTYFIRAKIPITEYNRMTFFVALYLAHDLEEDDEDLKCHIMRWGLGRTKNNEIEHFLRLRDVLWKSMDFRACVSMQCCLQVMRSVPDCPLWQRSRSPVHSGAERNYDSSEKCFRCLTRTILYHGSGCESNETESSSDEEENYPFKKLKQNEE